MTHGSLKHPGRWIWFILAIPIALGLARLRFDVEIFNLMPRDLPAVEGLRIHQQHFANARELILTLEAPSAEDAEAAAQSITAELRGQTNLVTSVTWQPPWLERPQDSAELIAYLWYNQPPEALRELAVRLEPAGLSNLLASARDQLATSMSPGEIAQLSYDPFGFTRLPGDAQMSAPAFAEGNHGFASQDGLFRVIFIQARPDLKTYEECATWLKGVNAVLTKALLPFPRVSVNATGRPAFVSEIAGGMQRDITISVGGTAVIIAILFWIAHRRIVPMLWLLTLLSLILGSTLAFGGLIYGAINVLSIGFAAILLGLAVDYAVVHYQEALANPSLSVPQIRHAIAPSIIWAAVTTIAAFLVLNFGGLPGLGQLGTLVAIGVSLAATIMVFEFLPPLFPSRDKEVSPLRGPNPALLSSSSPVSSRWSNYVAAFISCALVIGSIVVLVWAGLPAMDPTAGPLRPRNSKAYATLDRVQKQFASSAEPVWLIVRGSDENATARELAAAERILSHAASNHLVSSYNVPTALWPRPEFQQQNRALLLELAGRWDIFRTSAVDAGFAGNSLGLTENILQTWRSAARNPGPFWPTNQMSRWIFEKLTAHSNTNFYALALIQPPQGGGTTWHRQLAMELNSSSRWLTGWELLGDSIFTRVSGNFWKILGPMICLVLISLGFAFKRWTEVLLSVVVLLLSSLCLLAIMRAANWSWNLLNLMALPLILGTGVDYSIFMLLGLRRYGGDLAMTFRSVGRALLLCGGTAIAGFASLGVSSNAGMASLGLVCATGIAGNMLIAIFLLPYWWQKTGAGREAQAASGAAIANLQESSPTMPSSLYAARTWHAGMLLARVLPFKTAQLISRALLAIYWALAVHRRKVVIRNLLPALGGDWRVAEQTARRLYRNFALKLVDLLRYEAGLPIESVLGEADGWEFFLKAREKQRGVLLITPHLGNWEFGAPFLTQKDVPLQVVTLAEPGSDLTELRENARNRRNIKTLIIGKDPFAFVEIIRQLENGAVVALLIDRPPTATAVEVTLFGQSFAASIAAAELARASGCVILPVYIPHDGVKYRAGILPEVSYERAALRDRKERQQLTQRIISAFEPVIRDHLDQWYHFVPVWGRTDRSVTAVPATTVQPQH